jgi:hypothetical protein
MAGGQAYAAECPGSILVSAITPGFACSEDDKTFSSFDVVTGDPGALVLFRELGGPNFEVSLSRGAGDFPATAEVTFDYTVAVNSGSATITRGTTGVDATQLTGTAVSTVAAMGGSFMTGSPITNSGNAFIDFSPGLSSVGVQSHSSINGNELTGITNIFTQTPVVTTPEPASFALFGLGLVGLWFAGRRKRRN